MRTANKVEMPPWKMAGPMEDIVWISRWFISPLEVTKVVISRLAKLVRPAGIQNGAHHQLSMAFCVLNNSRKKIHFCLHLMEPDLATSES